jgi:uncharacterized membrane protein
MTQWLILWLVVAVVFLCLDLIWLTWLGRGLYVSEIGGLLREKINFGAAIAFYLLYVTGTVFFAVRPSLGGTLPEALALGAFFGLVAYGTYDLTNLAVAKGFTTRIALIDMAWGTFLTAVSTGAAHVASRFVASQSS